MSTIENRRQFLALGGEKNRDQASPAAVTGTNVVAGGTPVFNVTVFGANPHPLPLVSRDILPDCSAQVQAAMNAAAAVGGLVYFPAGQYRISTIIAPGNVSVCGDGQATILLVEPGNGLIFQSSATDNGARRISDLSILGSNVGVGVWLQGGQGILIQNVFVEYFTWGVRCDHVKQVELLSVTTLYCFHGVTIFGRSENIYIGGCRIQRGREPTSPEGSYGIYIDAYEGGTPKHIRVGAGTLVFGFGCCILAANMEDLSVNACDLDAFIHCAFSAINVTKGCRLTDSYLAASGYVAFSAIGLWSSGPNTDSFVFERNAISTNRPREVDCNGIHISDGYSGSVSIRDNQIVDMVKCIVLLGTSGVVVEGNHLATVSGGSAVLTRSPAKNNIFRDNNFMGGVSRYPGATDVFENNRGSTTTCFHGKVSIPAGMPPPLPAAGGAPTHVVALSTLLSDQGIPGAPISREGEAYFNIRARGFQCAGDGSRGRVRAFYDWGANVNIQFDTPSAYTVSDIWVDVDVS